MNNNEVLLEFLSDPKGLLIAPAGHGKTYSIAQMVSSVEANKPQLILTHTHAGIASLKKKFREQGIPPKKYAIETICGFIQRYVLTLCKRTDVPNQENESFFQQIEKIAVHIFSKPAVRRIVAQSYSHLYVDEYQDCTLDQHKIIILMSEELPTHLLGDPLQGIFDFAQPIVDFEKDLLSFNRYDFLQTPWRWKNSGKENLGQLILGMRQSLSKDSCINLVTNNEACCFIYNTQIQQRPEFFLRELGPFLAALSQRSNSILVIFPSYIDYEGIPRGTISDRSTAKPQIDVRNEFTLIEAIDDSSYYKCAKTLDDLLEKLPRSRNPYKRLRDILVELSFKKSDVNNWISDKRIIMKRDATEKAKSEALSNLVCSIIKSPSYSAFLKLFTVLKYHLKWKPKRADVFSSVFACLKSANENGTLILEEMKKHKNRIRQIGRKIEGKCIGTTLLTKGLEFDTVVLIEAEQITSSKDFYVAISRSCKELHIFTSSDTLHFNK
ncbi:UvrD-helicase domain-containing protein [Porphyromonas endodontalis]|nr:UvrD-helicase domain-containing protein [Porphyromonas endodontalis]UBH64744.1 AAA family ATPase [Porphyromonas endodontalis]SUB76847.1 Viral (Superfamily 1) RNA helicase [Porphyromonas endodontalis]